ncbi:hypothetical protein [Thiohalophilus sp.]|uniref:hypothetical protein n=1 Tax=Thiohalophilus sp. TaxID=3028392 RepID=UPI002ACD4776|nr:hypothetical protein [Thiohalophilus sp.]MDZ7805099.1 hypothetical protein [Thiohalophilus sp.]
MEQLKVYFQQADLAMAAYASLSTGEPSQAELIRVGMSLIQAEAFASHWRVADQFNHESSGLSATIFEEVSSERRYLAVRGTEGLSDLQDILTDIVDIGFWGYTRTPGAVQRAQ